MASDTNHIAFGHVIATGHLQAVVVDGQVLFVTGVVTQGDFGLVAFAHQFADGGDVRRSLGFFGVVGEILRHAVPAPFVGHQRGGVVQRASQADQHQHG
jgi:hypothetical protein